MGGRWVLRGFWPTRPGEGGLEGEGEGEGEFELGPWRPLPPPPDVQCDRREVDVDVWDAPLVVISKVDIEERYALDIDGDGVVENVLASQVWFRGPATTSLNSFIQDGSLSMLFEFRGAEASVHARCFDLNSYRGASIEAEPGEVSQGRGRFEVDPRSLNDQMQPRIRFSNAQIIDRVLFARADHWPLLIPLAGLPTVNLRLTGARIQARLDGFGRIVQGVLGGAVSGQDFALAAVDARIAAPGFDVFDFLGEPDLDMDRDGCAESCSLAIWFQAAAAEVVGVGETQPEPPDGCGDDPADGLSCEEALKCALKCIDWARSKRDVHGMACCQRAVAPEGADALQTLLQCPLDECLDRASAFDGEVCLAEKDAATYAACI